jgi:hypothetical protein
MVKIEQGSNLLNQIFNLITRYARKVHADEHIRRAICYSAWRSFLDVIRPSDIAYIVSMSKMVRACGIRNYMCKSWGQRGMENPDKKLKPLFTSGSGQKRTQGKSLWNLEGMKYFH